MSSPDVRRQGHGTAKAGSAVADKPHRLYRKGLRLLRAGEYENALIAFDRLVAQEGPYAPALNDSATALAQLGRQEEALLRFHQTCDGSPSYAIAHCNLGRLLLRLGRSREASLSLRRAVALSPHESSWWLSLGEALAADDDYLGSLAAVDEALCLNRSDAGAWLLRAAVLRQLRRLPESLSALRSGLSLEPTNVDAWCDLAVGLSESLNLPQAFAAVARAHQLRADSVRVAVTACALLLREGRADEALAVGHALVRTAPEHTASWNALCHAQLEMAQFSEANASCTHALTLSSSDAEAEYTLAHLQLTQGHYQDGLRHYEARRRRIGCTLRPPSGRMPEWDGQSLHGRSILVRHEQGLGDLLQFVRYASQLKERGASRVVFEAPVDTHRLLLTAPCVDQAVAPNASIVCDTWTPLMSLPYRCGTLADTIPSAPSYLTATDADAPGAVRQSERTLHVGVVWSGNPAHIRDRSRSIAFTVFASALANTGVSLFSLQQHIPAGTPPLADFGVHDLGAALRTLDDTASILTHLDLLVCVDTAVAHLAGALGVPVWMLIAKSPDWRWMLDRPDSPWYPSMRLYRQTRFASWVEPLAAIRRDLERLYLGKRSRPRPLGGRQFACSRAAPPPPR